MTRIRSGVFTNWPCVDSSFDLCCEMLHTGSASHLFCVDLHSVEHVAF